MRRTLLTLLAASSLAVAAPLAANAQTWPERHATFLDRVEDGLRSGELTASEAARLRADMDALMRTESRYRRSFPGLMPWELQDLDRRFDVLSDRLSVEMADNDRRDGALAELDSPDIDAVRSELDRRIDRSYREGRISRAEADRLHREARDLVRLESRYRATGPGITSTEVAELSDRVSDIEDRINDNISLGFGYGSGYRPF
jgi:hypothetical protein